MRRCPNCPSKVAVCSGLLSVLCFVCYWNSLSCDLVHDDIFAIRDNGDIRVDTPLSKLFHNDFWGKPMSDPTSHKSYRPLTVMTFRLNYAIHELTPWGYHLVNVLLHTLCTLLVYLVGEVAVFSSYPSSCYLSLQTASLFAVHPIHTEAVTGVVGRADILACILFLLSFTCYHKCISEVSAAALIVKLLGCLLFGCCATLCKEHGITVFGVCLAYEAYIKIQSYIRNKRFISGHAVVRITLILSVAVSLVIFRIWTLHGTLPQFSAHDNPASFAESLATRLMTYGYLCYYNAKLLMMPTTLCYDWQMGSIPLLESASDPRNISTCVFFFYLAGLFWTAFSARKTCRESLIVFLGTALLVIPFIPASNLFLRVGFVIAERVLYISSVGFCILVVYGLKVFSGLVPKGALIGKLVLIAIVTLFVFRTIDRNTVWRSRETLFRSGVDTLPNNAKVHYNYANFLKDTGSTQAAIYHYQEALRLSPDHASAHNNVATLLNGSEAVHHYRQAIKHNPRHFKACFNLANNLWNLNNSKEAELFYRESIRINPDYTDALIKLSSLLASQGKRNEYELFVSRIVGLNPNNPDVLHNSAAVLMTGGNVSRSIALYQRALLLNSSHVEAMIGLARAFRLLERNTDAEELYKRSLLIEQRASVYQSLAALYFNTGRLEESYVMFRNAMELEPSNLELLCSFAQVCHSLDKLEDLQEMVVISPDTYCSNFNLAGVLVKHGKSLLEKALLYSSRAIALARGGKELFDAHILHGTILKDGNNLSKAAESFEKATIISPKAVSAWINLGAVMHLMGNYEKAEDYYAKAQSLDPRNAIVQTNLDKLQRLRKQRPKY